MSVLTKAGTPAPAWRNGSLGHATACHSSLVPSEEGVVRLPQAGAELGCSAAQPVECDRPRVQEVWHFHFGRSSMVHGRSRRSHIFYAEWHGTPRRSHNCDTDARPGRGRLRVEIRVRVITS